MPAALVFLGPKPPPGLTFCAVCSAVFKGSTTQALKEETEKRVAMAADGQQVTVDLRKAAGACPIPLDVAIAEGIYPPMGPPGIGGNGMMPLPVGLCWSHLMGLSLTTGLMPASAAQMPQAPSGAVLLDGPRRGPR
jgi:hypothetical protein